MWKGKLKRFKKSKRKEIPIPKEKQPHSLKATSAVTTVTLSFSEHGMYSRFSQGFIRRESPQSVSCVRAAWVMRAVWTRVRDAILNRLLVANLEATAK